MYLMSIVLSSQDYPCLPHLIEIDLEAARTGSTWHHRCPTPTPAAGDGGLVGVARLFRAQVDGDLVLAQARQIQGNAQPVGGAAAKRGVAHEGDRHCRVALALR